MKKILFFIMLVFLTANLFSYTSIYFWQDFSDFPLGLLNLQILESNDDGTHGNNDEAGTHFSTSGDKRFFINSTADLSIVQNNGGKVLLIDAKKGEKAVFSIRNLPIQVNTNNMLHYNFFISYPAPKNQNFVLFSNSLNEKVERIEAVYSEGLFKVFLYRKGQKNDPEVLFEAKKNLVNKWCYFKGVYRDRELKFYVDNSLLYRTSAPTLDLSEIWMGINQKDSGEFSLKVEIDNLSAAHTR